MTSPRMGDDLIQNGAVYSSLKTQAHSLLRLSRHKDALNVYNDALFLNPRSKSILLDKSECLLEMGKPEQALKEVNSVFSNSPHRNKNPNDNWRAGVHRSSRPPPDQTEVPETLSDLSYKCRFLLNKADALYNKGDFENALMYYHKGHRLRPKAQEFKLGIIKAEDALKVLFTKKEQDKRKKESRKTVVRFAKPSELVKEIKDKKEESEKPKAKVEEKEPDTDDKSKTKGGKSDKDKPSGDGGDEGKEKENEEETRKKDGKRQTEKKGETKEDAKVKEENVGVEHTPLEESYSDKTKKEEERKDRIRESRLAFGVKEREEARKKRAQYHSRPNGHLKDDILFLRMMYKTMGETEIQNKKVKRMTKDALKYLDSRNSFWGQQIPHHIKEKSLILPNRDKSMKPPPTQAMYAFMVKEMVRINNMMGKSQFHRSIETAKKLITHIGKMERKIPDKENVMANCFSMIGNCYLELGEDKKSLAFHMKDLEMATKCDLDEAKLRALDNVGRVYARTGEFHKAIAIWEEKMSTPFTIKPGERAWLYHEMGYCCIEVDDPEKAKDCGLKAYEAAVEKEDKKWQMNAKILISQAMLRCGEAFEAKEEFQKALDLAKDIGDAEAQKKTEDALKELEEVLAEWDYMDSEAEDAFEDDNEDQAEEPAQRATSPTTSQGGDSIHTKTSWSTAKKSNQADWLLVEEEHKQLEQEEGYYDKDEEEESSAAVIAENSKDSKSTDKKQQSVKSLPPKPKKAEGSTKGSQKKTIVQPQKSSTSPAKSSVVEKPKREKSNVSLTSKPSRQGSNASLRTRKSKEGSFSRPPRRELSNQSLNRQGRISRESSNASLKSKKTQQIPQQKPEDTAKPATSRLDDAAAIYLEKGKALSREASNVSKRSQSKPQPKPEPNKDSKGQKPSAEEQRINRHAIDSVAAMNDPEKSTLGMDDITEANDVRNQMPPRETTMTKLDDKAFMTENTTLTSSTVQRKD